MNIYFTTLLRGAIVLTGLSSLYGAPAFAQMETLTQDKAAEETAVEDSAAEDEIAQETAVEGIEFVDADPSDPESIEPEKETAVDAPLPLETKSVEETAIDLDKGESKTKPATPLVAEAETSAEIDGSLLTPALEPAYENCEIVLVEPIGEGGSLASYRPADEFLHSVFDDQDGYLKTVDTLQIRAVMCTRPLILPTIRDFPIVATGVQFSISNDFDSSESRLITVYYSRGAFRYKYTGPDLSFAQELALKDRIDIYNLQSHTLSETTPK